MRLLILLTIGYQILFVCHVLAASLPQNTEDEKLPSLGSDNDVVDMIVDSVRDLMEKENVEPIDLPRRNVDADIGPIHFAIEATSGKLTGLKTLERIGDSTVHYNHTEGHTAKINAQLGLGDTHITYHMDFYASVFDVGCDIEANATDMSIGMAASFCLDGSCEADVQLLSVMDVTWKVYVKVNIPGHSYFIDYIVDWIQDLFTNIVFKKEINKVIEDNLKKIMLEALNRIHV